MSLTIVTTSLLSVHVGEVVGRDRVHMSVVETEVVVRISQVVIIQLQLFEMLLKVVCDCVATLHLTGKRKGGEVKGGEQHMRFTAIPEDKLIVHYP